eukprot:2239826-Pyramimonas_sp.AAC.1
MGAESGFFFPRRNARCVQRQLQAQGRNPQTLARRLALAPVAKAPQPLVTLLARGGQAQSECVNRE